ncbi:exopolysaccharide biosynthesis polyprenyl glycosylphosphotransferase [Kerstersia gyiorum]|uniref:exopolysaccharide biosynthesis polyprenyl glycosylphosphotransferase n=1 Tax=Kerstersia gyiorum TaxID=206506 RepID=UPI0021505836|nr:exopolysaccharide biosynthesis polyprenyl glycosylphosphotransferase [Kerstersia gyiorum]MCR4158884.1 exopolysaccharide biosynthesis polyprenyl glycosylphosphotransferase [Kerstersia gyiorum]
MSSAQHRRHKRLYEQILLSRGFSILVGWLLAVLLPFVAFWSWQTLLRPDSGQLTALIVTTLAYVTSHLCSLRLRATYPGGRSAAFIAPQVLILYGLFALCTFMLQLPVSRYLLVASGACATLWLYLEYTLTYKYMSLKLAVVPGGRYTSEILAMEDIKATPLTTLALDRRYDGVVADFHQIDDATQRFLTQCALNRTAVYDARQIYESLSGRVEIHRMSENNMGSLLPSPIYERLKQIIDILFVIAMSPIVLTIGLITALLIKLESPGPAIYTQTRIGQGNKPFTIYKFRSMRFDRDAPEQFADEDDPRVTRVGRIIRKLRIDELPQFFNILKGDMSLIGPRPEQPTFVKQYEEIIPFYSYRHIVKPGISGWAQVRQGYTASTDETQIKIQHDFYYIKNCSLTLDLMITILTIRIMLTGFGAR